MTAYYNEIDPKAAAWLRELIKQGHIAPGEVDERNIADVLPRDLLGFTQCHFFAGIGVWSWALRQAGWPDDKPVWTGSCPCQPFSQAGKGAGTTDERHLWPAFHHLIRVQQPGVVFGEQVASKAGLGWLDLVQADLEGAGYASGAVDLCAAGVGAPHIRQRLYFVAEKVDNTTSSRHLGEERNTEGDSRDETWVRMPNSGCATGGMAEPHSGQCERRAICEGDECNRADAGREESCGCAASCCETGRVANACGKRGGRNARAVPRAEAESGGGGEEAWCITDQFELDIDPSRMAQSDGGDSGAERQQRSGEYRLQPQDAGTGDSTGRPGPTNGFWRDVDWLGCRDGKWRPVKPGTFPLANGAPARVGRLRGYGNAICAPVAQAFIEAYMQ